MLKKGKHRAKEQAGEEIWCAGYAYLNDFLLAKNDAIKLVVRSIAWLSDRQVEIVDGVLRLADEFELLQQSHRRLTTLLRRRIVRL